MPEMPLSLLGSVRDLEDGELPRLYGYPERDATWVRANFITSVDGGATSGGSSGAMGGPGDRFIFNLLRELADVIVVGAGTVRIEGYSGAQLSAAQRQHRQARGQSEVPPLAIVTKSGHLNRDMAVFTRTEVPPLVLTCAAAAPRPGGCSAACARSSTAPAAIPRRSTRPPCWRPWARAGCAASSPRAARCCWAR